MRRRRRGGRGGWRRHFCNNTGRNWNIFTLRHTSASAHAHTHPCSVWHLKKPLRLSTILFPPREPFHFFKHISSGTLSDITTDIHTLHSRLLKESAPKENVLQVANCYLEHFSDIAKEYKLNSYSPGEQQGWFWIVPVSQVRSHVMRRQYRICAFPTRRKH